MIQWLFVSLRPNGWICLPTRGFAPTSSSRQANACPSRTRKTATECLLCRGTHLASCASTHAVHQECHRDRSFWVSPFATLTRSAHDPCNFSQCPCSDLIASPISALWVDITASLLSTCSRSPVSWNRLQLLFALALRLEHDS